MGIAAYERALRAKIERVRVIGLKNLVNVADPEKNSSRGVWYDHVDEGVNPYESQFGENRKDNIPAKFDVVSIKDLIDLTIDEGNKLFVDTRLALTWFIYHDALPQWSETNA